MNHEKPLILRDIRRTKAITRQIYEKYIDRVYAYVGYRVGNNKDTEDIVSEVFISISRSILKDYEDLEMGMDAWIFTIARNKVIDFYRKNSRRPKLVSLDDIPDLFSNHSQPEEKYINKELFQILHQLVNNLPKRQQEIVSLRFFGQLKNKEIAMLLGIEERTVSGYLTRAVKKLEFDYKRATRIENQVDEANHE